MSGTGDGMCLTDIEVLDHVELVGSLLVTRGPAERLRRPEWAVELAILARSRGVSLSIRDTGRVVLIFDLDWGGRVPERDDDCDESSVRANHPSRGAGLRLVPDTKR